ncbi:hypothetical protein B0H14DRAFT_2571054 [Mycena olivaceomarginata]|nr:hypothetical protein B0H14DRAFT_2571054 [Mycena olivaceomarginata]
MSKLGFKPSGAVYGNSVKQRTPVVPDSITKEPGRTIDSDHTWEVVQTIQIPHCIRFFSERPLLFVSSKRPAKFRERSNMARTKRPQQPSNHATLLTPQSRLAGCISIRRLDSQRLVYDPNIGDGWSTDWEEWPEIECFLAKRVNGRLKIECCATRTRAYQFWADSRSPSEKVFAGLREFLEHALDGYENKPNVVVPMRAGGMSSKPNHRGFKLTLGGNINKKYSPEKPGKGKAPVARNITILPRSGQRSV